MEYLATAKEVGSYAANARNIIIERRKLNMELESVREWLAEIKLFVEDLLEDEDTDLCTLPDFIDTMNAVQLFIYNNFLDPSVLTKGFLEIWPAWYRTELNHAVDHLERSWTTVLVELGSYDRLGSSDKCKRFSEYYRKEYAKKPKKWDICSKCTKKTGTSLSLRDSYNRIVKDAKDFESLRQKIERDNSNLPDPIIKAPEEDLFKQSKVILLPPPVDKPPTITLTDSVTLPSSRKPRASQMTRSSSLLPATRRTSRSRSD